MIPSHVIQIPAIPLTQHGKVDRARLPAPSTDHNGRINSTLGTSEERRIAAIWANLLGRNHIGLDDNFFDLGGHSVLVAALQNRLANEFGLRVSMIELFRCPTVRQQVELTSKQARGNFVLPPGVVVLQPNGSGNCIFWIEQLMGNLASVIGDERPFFAATLTEQDCVSLGDRPNLQEIGECLLRKIQAVQPAGPYLIGGLCVSGILAYEIASQLMSAGHEVRLLVLLDAPNPAFVGTDESQSSRFEVLQYFLKRVGKIGLRKSIIDFRNRLLKRWRGAFSKKAR